MRSGVRQKRHHERRLLPGSRIESAARPVWRFFGLGFCNEVFRGISVRADADIRECRHAVLNAYAAKPRFNPFIAFLRFLKNLFLIVFF